MHLQIVKKGVQSNLLVAYVLHEVDEGAEKVEGKDISVTEGEPQLRCAAWHGQTLRCMALMAAGNVAPKKAHGCPQTYL